MSRVGYKPVALSSDVKVKMDNDTIIAEGKLGQLSYKIPSCVQCDISDSSIEFDIANSNEDNAKALFGTTRSNVANIVEGVTKGFTKSLQLVGVGYRASIKGKFLVISLGYSHDIIYSPVEGIKIECISDTEILVSGIDKRLVGDVAAKIKSFRKPEPYKGKGVRYKGEYIFRKETKKKK